MSATRVLVVVAVAVVVAGCGDPRARDLRNQLPPARAPVLLDVGGIGGTQVMCWGPTGRIDDCYLPTRITPPAATPIAGGPPIGNYQLAVTIEYQILNVLSVQEDGVMLAATDSATPGSAETRYSLSEPTTLAGGIARSTLFIFPRSFPRSKAGGEVSRFTIVETASGGQHRGTPGEKASTTLDLTYVEPGRCQASLSAPPQVARGSEASASYVVTGCKTFTLAETASTTPPPCTNAGVLPGGLSPVEVASETAPVGVAAQTFANRRSVTIQGVTSWRLRARDALGRAAEATATTGSPPRAQCDAGGSPPPGSCTQPQPLVVCISCPGLINGPADVRELSTSTCDPARTRRELAAGGLCTVTDGQCPRPAPPVDAGSAPPPRRDGGT